MEKDAERVKRTRCLLQKLTGKFPRATSTRRDIFKQVDCFLILAVKCSLCTKLRERKFDLSKKISLGYLLYLDGETSPTLPRGNTWYHLLVPKILTSKQNFILNKCLDLGRFFSLPFVRFSVVFGKDGRIKYSMYIMIVVGTITCSSIYI